MRAEDALQQAKAYIKKSLAGAGALKGQDGKDGTDGADGKDGTSITVVSSNKVDGVSTTVLSDGTTIVVKDGTDGVDGKDGKDGSLGTVSVKTGKFAINEQTQRIYSNLGMPVVDPVIAKDASGRYMAVSANGTWGQIWVCDDLSSNEWIPKTVQGISQAIIDIAYSENCNCYYAIDMSGTTYITDDYESNSFASMTVNTNNLDSIPMKLVNIDGDMYILCDTGELCYVNSQNPSLAESTGVIHDSATGVDKLHGCYIFQGNDLYTASIHDGFNEIENIDKEDNAISLVKILPWGGSLIGIGNEGDLYVKEARFLDELISSYWTYIGSISLEYIQGSNTMTDTPIDIIVCNGKCYILGSWGMYRLNKDFSVTAMQDEVINFNIHEMYSTWAMELDDGFVYKINTNELLKFEYGYEEIEATKAIQDIYNSLLN